MAYSKQTWNKYDNLQTEDENIENGAVVTDNRMNHIEDGIEASDQAATTHAAKKDNPHAVTKVQVGLGNVDNVQQAAKSTVDNHIANSSNPHAVTKSQVGLSNVDNIQQAPKSTVDSHIANKSNPHAVTAAQVSAYTKTEVDALISTLKLAMNPVGTILTTLNSANPSSYIGGIWERFGKGRTLVGVDENDSSLSDSNISGGTVNPLSAHNHTLRMIMNGSVAGAVTHKYGITHTDSNNWRLGDLSLVSETDDSLPASSTGGVAKTKGDNTAHNNWQPFITVYFWRRTT